MTYLQLVNGVLSRMREDTVDTLLNQDDVVVNIVKDLVNDAKRTVESAHNWNALQTEWSLALVNGTAQYALTDSGKYAIISSIYNSSGQQIALTSKEFIRSQPNAPAAKPTHYVLDGVNASGDVRLKLFPTPDNSYTYTVYGYKHQADLSSDADILLVPDAPVLYLALALAARERGEVGGQTAAEIFMMAQNYLSDAIALDANLSVLDDIWYTP